MNPLLNRVATRPLKLASWSAAQFGYQTGAYARRLSADHRPLILTYHGVVEGPRDPALDRFCVSAHQLRTQLEQLGRLVDFVGVNELRAGSRRPRPPALVSFDDGFETVYRIARPILRELGIPAIVSVPAGLVGTDRTVWSLEIDLLLLAGDLDAVEVPVSGGRRRFLLRNQMERERARQFARQTAWAGGGEVPLQLVDDLIRQFGPERFGPLLRSHENLRIMNATQLRDLARDGFAVAVHGYHHLGLGTLSAELIQREVCEARSTLAALVPDTTIDVFCLPYGSSSPMALARVRDAGFRACLTTDGGRVADPWLLARFDAAKSTAALLRDLARSR